MIPSIPPSVNHYKDSQIFCNRKTRKHFIKWTPTGHALAFKYTVRNLARGASLAPATLREQRRTYYIVRVVVFLGAGQRGDGDNFWKVIGDSLTFAGIIHSDAAVKGWIMWVGRDRENPRTEITIKRLDIEHSFWKRLWSGLWK